MTTSQLPDYLQCSPLEKGDIDTFLFHTANPGILIRVQVWGEGNKPVTAGDYRVKCIDDLTVDFHLQALDGSVVNANMHRELLERASNLYVENLTRARLFRKEIDEELRLNEEDEWNEMWADELATIENLVLSDASRHILWALDELNVIHGTTVEVDELRQLVESWPFYDQGFDDALEQLQQADLLLPTSKAGTLCMTALGYVAMEVEQEASSQEQSLLFSQPIE